MKDAVEALRRWTRPGVLLALLTLIGLGLRLAHLDTLPLWKDEVDSVEFAGRSLPDLLSSRFGLFANQPAAHYLLLALMRGLANPGTTSVWMRMPSALAGTALIPITYGLGRAWWGTGVGLLAAALVAHQTLLLGLSQDVRPYSLLAAGTALTVYCGVQATLSGGWGRWAALAVSAAATLLTSYVALTLVLPALLPAAAWLFGTAVGRRGTRITRIGALLTGVAVSSIAGLVALDAAGLHKALPDLGHPIAIALIAIGIATFWFAPSHVLWNGDLPLQAALLALAAVGLGTGLRAGGRAGGGGLLAAGLVVLPTAALAALRTSNPIAPRYGLFMVPFFCLLVAYGLVQVATWGRGATRAVVCAGLVGIGLLTLAAAYNYDGSGAAGFSRWTSNPDYRAVAAYLAQAAAPADMIVFVDEDPHGLPVTRFYSRGQLPASAWDVRDPRLTAARPGGRVFWVVSWFADDPARHDQLQAAIAAWGPERSFPAVTVVREDSDGRSLADRLARLAAALDATGPRSAPMTVVAGAAAAARGDVPGAVAAWRTAGAWEPIGDEELRTAEGWLARGDSDRAGDEAVIARASEPNAPAVHRWWAAWLAAQGDAPAAAQEVAIADLLARSADVGASP